MCHDARRQRSESKHVHSPRFGQVAFGPARAQVATQPERACVPRRRAGVHESNALPLVFPTAAVARAQVEGVLRGRRGNDALRDGISVAVSAYSKLPAHEQPAVALLTVFQALARKCNPGPVGLQPRASEAHSHPRVGKNSGNTHAVRGPLGAHCFNLVHGSKIFAIRERLTNIKGGAATTKPEN